MCNVFIKQISNHEYEMLNTINKLNLNDVTVPYCIAGNNLIMNYGKVVSYTSIDIVKLYKECLSKLYIYYSPIFSEGIYSCHFSKTKHNELNYYEYLISEIKELFVSVKEKNISNYEEIKQCVSLVENTYKRKNLNSRKEKYVLLHGDLFSGNILKYDDRYKLIDFEFIRFGPIIMELSFLLCWDNFWDYKNTIKDKISYLKEQYYNLINSGIITNEEGYLITHFYIPLLAIVFAIQQDNNLLQKKQNKLLKFVRSFFKEFV